MASLGPAQGGNRLHVKREGREDVLSRHQAPEAHLLKDAVECPLAAKLKKPEFLWRNAEPSSAGVFSVYFPSQGRRRSVSRRKAPA